MGRDRKRPLRADWEAVKHDVMRQALSAKFRQHQALTDLLLSTEDKTLVEASPTDYYWGSGATGGGKNMLGRLLMELRANIYYESK